MARVEVYLRSLPQGLESFPDCRAKASMLHAGLAVRPIPGERRAQVPASLRPLVDTPPPVSSWVSEVEYCALSLAMADLHGWTDEDFGQYWYDLTRKLVESKLYRGLIGMLTPQVALRSAAWRWSAFHRGSSCRRARHPRVCTWSFRPRKGCCLRYASVHTRRCFKRAWMVPQATRRLAWSGLKTAAACTWCREANATCARASHEATGLARNSQARGKISRPRDLGMAAASTRK